MQEPSLLPELCILLSLSGVVFQKAEGTCPPCSQNSFCVNDTYCTCNPGYTSQSGQKFFTFPLEICQDIDECKPPFGIYCGSHAKCQNVEGSFYCHCNIGYKLLSGDTQFKNSNENTCRSKKILVFFVFLTSFLIFSLSLTPEKIFFVVGTECGSISWKEIDNGKRRKKSKKFRKITGLRR
uniref:Adhesion G protein-coupled receptor E3 n=1 Tax=Rousettus aegyptiacus TaxID=9407 RepID=A0A7J8BN06_ROUAE|nr:adhesion G protein-coupled receptor E3 [Rousettus aegyptiacus]